MKAFGVKCGLQILQTGQILQLQIPQGCLTVTELLNKLSETVTDPLPSDKVVILNMSPHSFREKTLIAGQRDAEREGERDTEREGDTESEYINIYIQSRSTGDPVHGS